MSSRDPTGQGELDGRRSRRGSGATVARRPGAVAIGLALVFTLVAVTRPLDASSASPGEATESWAHESATARPAYFIETITVDEAARFSTDLIVAESRLLTGQTYDERSLREALFRIVRLPLILDADFTLRKGTERGRYELVITVREARRWFFGIADTYTFWNRDVSVSGLSTSSSTETSNAFAGRRFSAGRYGVLFLAIGGVDGSLNAGYSHHNLFDRRVLFQSSLSFSSCGNFRAAPNPPDQEGEEGCRTELFDLGLDPRFSTWSILGETWRLRASFGIPLEGNQSIRLAASYRWAEEGLRRPAYLENTDEAVGFRDQQDWDLAATWVLDSRDDPLFARTGQRLDAGLSIRSLRASLGDLFLPSGDATPYEALEVGGLLDAARYWPIRDHDAIWLDGRGFLGTTDLTGVPTPDGLVDDSAFTWRAAIGGGYGRMLYRVHTERKWRELRWETRADLLASGTSPAFGSPENPIAGYRVGTGLTYRTSWGVFSLHLFYQDLEGR